ncbi:hypothetical protein BC628DRAFT_1319918 [Trametes gibbosa]|nr:hypothetical protein BC628DRAFT_1319918 [Trametes gibbosa]
MEDLASLLQEAEGHLALLTVVKVGCSVALTLILLDIVETFSDEVRLVWPSPLSIMKIVFFVNRYMPVLDVTLGLFVPVGVRTHEESALNITSSKLTCSVMWPIVVALYPMGSFVSEVILMVRTVALWSFNRIIVALMVLNTLVIIVPTVAVVRQYLVTLNYPSTEVLQVTACVASISDGVGWVFFSCIIISETTVVTLTLLRQYLTAVRGSNLPLLLKTMYRDGTGFYVVLLCISVANLLCMTVAPVWVSSAMQLPHRAVHSTLCSRVLLNLRAAAARSSGLSLDDFNKRSHIAFETPGARTSGTTECEDDDSLITLAELPRREQQQQQPERPRTAAEVDVWYARVLSFDLGRAWRG